MFDLDQNSPLCPYPYFGMGFTEHMAAAFKQRNVAAWAVSLLGLGVREGAPFFLSSPEACCSNE